MIDPAAWYAYRKFNVHFREKCTSNPITLDRRRLASCIFQPGTLVGGGRFKIIRAMYISDNSQIYDAEDLKGNNREVVVKVAIRWNGGEFFRREIKALRQNVAPGWFPEYIADFCVRGVPCLVMSKLRGENLVDRINDLKEKFPLWQALNVAYQLLEQLSRLHKGESERSRRQGGYPWPVNWLCHKIFMPGDSIIHGDIKPENVIVDYEEDNAKLFDFNLARMIEDRAACGPSGTPAFMAPEVLDPDCRVEPSCDLYSLGIAFYEMIAGDNPMYAANEARIFDNQRNNLLPLISDRMIMQKLGNINDEQAKLVVVVTAKLNDFIQKITDKNHKLRYQTATDAMDDLAQIMELWEYLAPLENSWPLVD